ncbi:hypothetical protein BV898_05381 [Hypsibius exemplaris]|uniref:Uncharacterized protein n=1 Tax=Hypsibius exemplaris TaxID=2072580 RepID=A0A1W0WZD8_HYPEX|nr:hypothetical protein BV898_05381 [Hypsibius exemplaris]
MMSENDKSGIEQAYFKSRHQNRTILALPVVNRKGLEKPCSKRELCATVEPSSVNMAYSRSPSSQDAENAGIPLCSFELPFPPDGYVDHRSSTITFGNPHPDYRLQFVGYHLSPDNQSINQIVSIAHMERWQDDEYLDDGQGKRKGNLPYGLRSFTLDVGNRKERRTAILVSSRAGDGHGPIGGMSFSGNAISFGYTERNPFGDLGRSGLIELLPNGQVEMSFTPEKPTAHAGYRGYRFCVQKPPGDFTVEQLSAAVMQVLNSGDSQHNHVNGVSG